MLRKVPEYTDISARHGGLFDHPRFYFFGHQEGIRDSPNLEFRAKPNNTKHYYRRNGDNLEYLGKFVLIKVWPNNQAGSSAYRGYLDYYIYFENDMSPQRSRDTMKDELYYIDIPAGSVPPPLTIDDIPAAGSILDNPIRTSYWELPEEQNLGNEIGSLPVGHPGFRGGKSKTKKHRKNKKKHRKTRNKKHLVKV